MAIFKVVMNPAGLTEMKTAAEAGNSHLVYLIDTESTYDISFKYRSSLGFTFFVSGSTGDWSGVDFIVPSNIGQQLTKTLTGITLSSIGNIIGIAFGDYWSSAGGDPGTLWIEIGEIEFHKTYLGGNTQILNGGGTGASVFVDSNSDGLADYFSMWIVGGTNLITQVHDADTNFDVRHQYYEVYSHHGDINFLIGTYS